MSRIPEGSEKEPNQVPDIVRDAIKIFEVIDQIEKLDTLCEKQDLSIEQKYQLGDRSRLERERERDKLFDLLASKLEMDDAGYANFISLHQFPRINRRLMEIYLKGDGTDDFARRYEMHLLSECKDCMKIVDAVDDEGLDELGEAALRVFAFADGERRKLCPPASDLLGITISRDVQSHIDGILNSAGSTGCKLCREERDAVMEQCVQNKKAVEDILRRKDEQKGN